MDRSDSAPTDSEASNVTYHKNGGPLGPLRSPTACASKLLTACTGDTYDGDLRAGRRHGFGRYTFASGGFYEGSAAPSACAVDIPGSFPAVACVAHRRS